MQYDKLVFIGRFQPFHYGHAKVIETALQMAKQVVVLVGSANAPPNIRNPFLFDERKAVIRAWFLEEVSQNDINRLIILPLNDHTYNDQGWITEVQQRVDSVTNPGEKVGLIGHSKDHSSYYLSLFPQWGSVNVPAYTDRHLFNSTDVRKVFFDPTVSTSSWNGLIEGLPSATFRFLDMFRKSDSYNHLCEEHVYIEKYRKDHAYTNAGYEATHTTVDAVVVQSGHVLMVRRGAHPGKGLVALPGGFIDPHERLLEGMLRELYEETRLKVPKPVLAGNIKDQKVFDDPHRSARGRIFSHTFLIVLPADPKGLPKVKGSSDASEAWWMPLSRLDPMEMFEDHYHIVQNMTGGL